MRAPVATAPVFTALVATPYIANSRPEYSGRLLLTTLQLTNYPRQTTAS